MPLEEQPQNPIHNKTEMEDRTNVYARGNTSPLRTYSPKRGKIETGLERNTYNVTQVDTAAGKSKTVQHESQTR